MIICNFGWLFDCLWIPRLLAFIFLLSLLFQHLLYHYEGWDLLDRFDWFLLWKYILLSLGLMLMLRYWRLDLTNLILFYMLFYLLFDSLFDLLLNLSFICLFILFVFFFTRFIFTIFLVIVKYFLLSNLCQPRIFIIYVPFNYTFRWQLLSKLSYLIRL